MHHDEETTHAKVTALLADSITPAIIEHGGRIVKNIGDGFLAGFPSAVEAVRAAVQFQTRVNELTNAEVVDRRTREVRFTPANRHPHPYGVCPLGARS